MSKNYKSKKKEELGELYVTQIEIDFDILEDFIENSKIPKSRSKKKAEARKALWHLKNLLDEVKETKEDEEYHDKVPGKVEVVVTCTCKPSMSSPV